MIESGPLDLILTGVKWKVESLAQGINISARLKLFYWFFYTKGRRPKLLSENFN